MDTTVPWSVAQAHARWARTKGCPLTLFCGPSGTWLRAQFGGASLGVRVSRTTAIPPRHRDVSPEEVLLEDVHRLLSDDKAFAPAPDDASPENVAEIPAKAFVKALITAAKFAASEDHVNPALGLLSVEPDRVVATNGVALHIHTFAPYPTDEPPRIQIEARPWRTASPWSRGAAKAGDLSVGVAGQYAIVDAGAYRAETRCDWPWAFPDYAAIMRPDDIQDAQYIDVDALRAVCRAAKDVGRSGAIAAFTPSGPGVLVGDKVRDIDITATFPRASTFSMGIKAKALDDILKLRPTKAWSPRALAPATFIGADFVHVLALCRLS